MSSNGSPVKEHDARLRVEHVLHSLAPEGAGTSVSVPALCEALGEEGCAVALHVTDAGHVRAPVAVNYRLDVHRCLPGTGSGRLGVAPSMHMALVKAGRRAHVVHSHGLWLFANMDVYWATRRGSARLVLSPHGMLEPYGLHRRGWLKRIVWLLGQGAAARATACVHVTATSEYESVRAAGLHSPVAVVPNGVAIPRIMRGPATARKRLLFLGRIDHKKGIDFLLHAWSRIAREFPNWELRIVGPSFDDYEAQMIALAARLKAPRVTFAPGAFGTARDHELAEADLFVLPTRSENFAMTVAESLAVGVPVVCSKGAPWAGLETLRCGRWVDIGVEPLVAGLRETMALPDDQRFAMGRRGRAWMGEEFGWAAQAHKMDAVYRWLLTGGAPPDYVQVDDHDRRRQ